MSAKISYLHFCKAVISFTVSISKLRDFIGHICMSFFVGNIMCSNLVSTCFGVSVVVFELQVKNFLRCAFKKSNYNLSDSVSRKRASLKLICIGAFLYITLRALIFIPSFLTYLLWFSSYALRTVGVSGRNVSARNFNAPQGCYYQFQPKSVYELFVGNFPSFISCHDSFYCIPRGFGATSRWTWASVLLKNIVFPKRRNVDERVHK